MKVLVLNCGSSSLKYQLIDSETEAVLAKGLCERIGIDGSNIAHQPAGGEKVKEAAEMPDHTAAVKMVIQKLTEIIAQSRHQLSLLLLPQPHRTAVDKVPSDDLACKSLEIAADLL